jgi:hypothetical protein
MTRWDQQIDGGFRPENATHSSRYFIELRASWHVDPAEAREVTGTVSVATFAILRQADALPGISVLCRVRHPGPFEPRPPDAARVA